MFIGNVIRESLNDQAPLAGLKPILERVVAVPDDPDAPQWHVDWFELSGTALRERLPALAAAMRPHWYAHFWEGEELCVIMAGRSFWAKAGDPSTWLPFQAYGDTVGVERRYTERIPTQPPGYLQEVLDRRARLGSVTLEGRFLRLEPLRPHHAAALYVAGQAPEIWRWMATSFTAPADAERFIASALAAEAAGKEHPFAVIWKESGQVIGSTRYMDLDPANRSVEVGWTWYTPSFWQTAVNPEAKLLLLGHAFESWGARRVWLKTDGENRQSQAAMRKLGAVCEGTLRNHRLRRDGSMRDTVVFSVIDTEWPGVKEGLLKRLGSQ